MILYALLTGDNIGIYDTLSSALKKVPKKDRLRKNYKISTYRSRVDAEYAVSKALSSYERKRSRTKKELLLQDALKWDEYHRTREFIPESRKITLTEEEKRHYFRH